MLIDIHVHTGREKGLRRPNGKRHPYPEELIAMLDAAGIDKAVVMSMVSPECRYCLTPPEEVLDICAQYPARLIPFCNVDPRMLTHSPASDFRPMLRHYKDAGCKGVGEFTPNLPFDDPLCLNVFRQVEEVGLPLTFHIAPRIGGAYGCYDELGLPRLENVLKACPNLVMLGHSQAFWSEIGADVNEQTRGGYPKGAVVEGRVVELLRRYPNLHGDLSAGSGLNAIARDPEFGCRFLEEFQDRLCFGTDIANSDQRPEIVPYFAKLKAGRLISAEAYEKIAWRNASRLLRLNLEA